MVLKQEQIKTDFFEYRIIRIDNDCNIIKISVMDKINGFFRRLVQVDIFNGFYFYGFVNRILNITTFESQIKTGPSSAGEQLARDVFDTRRECQSKETILVSFDIFRELYALKNSLINFFFRSGESPL